eukprot:11175616-Lingulodinium_polyedra.AAC.1
MLRAPATAATTPANAEKTNTTVAARTNALNALPAKSSRRASPCFALMASTTISEGKCPAAEAPRSISLR